MALTEELVKHSRTMTKPTSIEKDSRAAPPFQPWRAPDKVASVVKFLGVRGARQTASWHDFFCKALLQAQDLENLAYQCLNVF